jgi:polyhydroxyalkanoate synthesis repressor PhaR
MGIMSSQYFAVANNDYLLLFQYIQLKYRQYCCRCDNFTSTMAKNKKDPNKILIKRYANRRLYNTETSRYITLQDLIALIRSGNEIQVIDSSSKEDVTKLILTQIILEAEKNKQNLLPTAFLYQIIRSQDESVQDFFQNYLAASFDAYMKTRQEFERRFRGWLEMGSSAPQMWEKFFPGAEMMKEMWGIGKKEKDEEEG